MLREPIWISKRLVMQVHEIQLAEHGGPAGVLNEHILDSALDRPRTKNGYEPSCSAEDLAASLAVALAKGHAFADGNKRTACVVALTFLKLNGIKIEAPSDQLAEVFESIAKGTMVEVDLALWFEENRIAD